MAKKVTKKPLKQKPFLEEILRKCGNAVSLSGKWIPMSQICGMEQKGDIVEVSVVGGEVLQSTPELAEETANRIGMYWKRS